jgi:hypothetical protein
LITRLSKRITEFIIYNSKLTEIDRSDFELKIKVLLIKIFVTIASLIYGILQHDIIGILISLSLVMVVRVLNEGFHVNSPDLCFVSTFCFIVSIHIIHLYLQQYIIAMYIVAIAINILTRRKLSTILLCFLSIEINLYLAIAFFVQSFDLIIYKLKR